MPNRKEMVEQMRRSPDDENSLNKITFMKSFLTRKFFMLSFMVGDKYLSPNFEYFC